MGYTANAITDSLGRYNTGDFDLTALTPGEVGEQKDFWEREVTYRGEASLEDIFSKDKYLKYDLIASILVNQEKVPIDTLVEMYTSGVVKELRIKKKRYRVVGNTYLGMRKK